MKYPGEAVGVVCWGCQGGFPEAVGHSHQEFTGRQGGIVSRGPGCVKAEGCEGLGASWELGVVRGGWPRCRERGRRSQTWGSGRSQATVPHTGLWVFPEGRGDLLGVLTKQEHGHGLEDKGGIEPDWRQETQAA